MKPSLLDLKVVLALALMFVDGVSDAQLIAYESFSAMTLGAGVSGSGIDATGWTDAGWGGGSDSRFQTIDPTPDLTYQLSGGPLLNGSNRALQLSTSPEPVPGVLQALRTIPAQNTTLYFSFLFRPVTIGTGTDSIELRIGSDTTAYGRIAFRPDQNAAGMQPGVYASGGSVLSSQLLTPGQTYLIAARITRPNSANYGIEYWINPTSAFPGGGTVTYGTLSSAATVTTIGFTIASTDTGGPASTVIVDELRVGYTWSDVVPPGPSPQLVPDLQMTEAIKLSWQSQTGKSYQVQISYDLATWANTGTPIVGNGTLKTFFDSTLPDAKKFYRVQIQ